ncbi:MAG: hypothetical protein PHI34_11970, partial [Acidobacteriota bacterium]|nr:hypothetical protein [Acidobacteriota bacterium]
MPETLPIHFKYYPPYPPSRRGKLAVACQSRPRFLLLVLSPLPPFKKGGFDGGMPKPPTVFIIGIIPP